MMEWFDMGKYDFFVWGSIFVFMFALLVDFISVKISKKHIKRLIVTKHKRQLSQTKRRNQS